MEATDSDVAIGNVSGTSVTAGAIRIVTITAGEGWTGQDWDAVSRALKAHDGYADWDYREMDDGSEQWRIEYMEGV